MDTKICSYKLFIEHVNRYICLLINSLKANKNVKLNNYLFTVKYVQYICFQANP